MNQAIAEKKKYLLHWMYDFIEDEDEEPAYLACDVDECDQLLTAFITHIDQSPQKADFNWLSQQLEELVNQLNIMNKKHDNQLIETNQREDLVSLIDLIIQAAGHGTKGDITAPWRDW